MLRGIPWSFPRMLEYGFPLGVIAGFVTSVFFPSVHSSFQGTYFVDAPNFGGSMLILGFLSLSAIHWTRPDLPTVILLKLSGLVIGLVCAIRSSERGIWIAIPVLLVLWSLRRLSLKYCAAVAIAAVVVAAVAYVYFPKIQARVSQTRLEISAILEGNLNTSIGQRLQIWRAAVSIIRADPVFGVGPTNVDDELKAYEGWSSSVGLQAALSQIHNEILGYTLRLGIFGLLSILAIYVVPFVLFLKAAVSEDRIRNSAAIMGTLVVAAYFTFGLTFEVFVVKMFATFYAMTVATLLATARNSEGLLYGVSAITKWSTGPAKHDSAHRN
jgi:O-antigen ligase